MGLHDTVKKFTACAEFHNDVYIPVVDKRLMELYNIRMVNLSQDKEFFLQQLNILCNVSPQNALNRVRHLWIRFRVNASDCAEVTTSYYINKLVYCSDVCR